MVMIDAVLMSEAADVNRMELLYFDSHPLLCCLIQKYVYREFMLEL
jgi:hypothetical protein